MKLSHYFHSEEFRCRCGFCEDSKEFIPDTKLIQVLTAVREFFGAPVTINSCKRCHLHNAAVGGSQRSQHLTGSGADIVVQGVTASRVYDFLNDSFFRDKIGLGQYVAFTHVDIRGHKARW